MTINYIVKGFDKDFYNFDAVVVPLQKSGTNKMEAYYYEKEWIEDINATLNQLTDYAFEFGKAISARSEKTGRYYIFICSRYDVIHEEGRKAYSEWLETRHEICFKSVFECIKQLDVQSILIQPLLFGYTEISEEEEIYKLFEELYMQNADLSNKKIYVIVNNLIIVNRKHAKAISKFNRDRISKEDFKEEMINIQMEQNCSYLYELIKKAEVETVFPEKSKVQQAYSELKQSSYLFDEYLNRYQGTATELAEKADIDPSTLSTIKSHKYREKSKKVVLSLAIALDLTFEDRKRFINSAGFSYPRTDQDRFIEQQLRKKRYTRVEDFNDDIWEEHPDFMLGRKSSK